MVSASLKKKKKKNRAALGSYGLSCLSWSWEAVSNKAAWNNRHVGMEGRFTLLHWLWVAILRGLGIVSCKTECRLWETMCLYSRLKKKKEGRGSFGCLSATLQKERLALFLIHNMSISTVPDLTEGGRVGPTCKIKGTINLLSSSACSKLLYPKLLPIDHFIGSPKLQLCLALSICPLWISYTPEKWTSKRDMLHLCCNAVVPEETGLVFLLLFIFCCQGCFSGGQIQSYLGQPSSWFSIVVWNCSPWHLSRKRWFTERGRGCVWGKGKGRSLLLEGLFLEPFLSICSAAWHALCLSYVFVILPWERAKNKCAGLENRWQDKQDAIHAPCFLGRKQIAWQMQGGNHAEFRSSP